MGQDNEYIGYARWRHRKDNQQPYLSICDSDDEGAFHIYREQLEAYADRLKEEFEHSALPSEPRDPRIDPQAGDCRTQCRD